ncbi:hypothetical protein MTR67_026845 [Solanum verrucosum]|uniref:Reverse transcriptase zinc-binding domain-containing protein n=1 Tax=Solanum verrucosum TaxID=315347 RepID=A0AAF0TZC7_SOLVR|nr:hypothetical protein MTR67_026845 [Solanum verrucosum]
MTWKHIWRTSIPHKVACFAWLLAKEAALTQDNLMKRKITMCSRCFLCGVKAEIVSPLFLYCKVTEQLWRIFFNFKGISWIMPGKIMEALQIWEETGSMEKNKSRWRIVPTCIRWTI